MIKGRHREIVMIVENNSWRFGIVVDSVSEVLDILDDQIEPPPQVSRGQEARFVQGLGPGGDQVKILLEAAKLWDEAEV